MPYRVTHINTSAGVGGGERLLLQLARYLHGSEFQFDFIVPEQGVFCDRLDEAGLQWRVVEMTGKFRAASCVELYRLFGRERPDIVHTYGARASWYARVPARLAAVPLVFCTVQNSLLDYPYPRWRRSIYTGLEMLTGRVVDQWIAVSAALRDDMVARYGIGPDQIQVVSNGVVPEEIQAIRSRESIRKELGIDQAGLVVIEVARMTDQKGQAFLLEAVRLLEPEFPDLQCLLAGDGPNLQALKDQSHRLGIENRVQFLGFRHDIPDLLQASDIAVLPSLSEGMPIAVLESMGVGCATVASSVNGTAEIIQDHSDGLLVPPADVPALTRALAELARNPELRAKLAEQGREKVLRHFSAERMARTVGDLYRRRLEKGADPGGVESPVGDREGKGRD